MMRIFFRIVLSCIGVYRQQNFAYRCVLLMHIKERSGPPSKGGQDLGGGCPPPLDWRRVSDPPEGGTRYPPTKLSSFAFQHFAPNKFCRPQYPTPVPSFRPAGPCRPPVPLPLHLHRSPAPLPLPRPAGTAAGAGDLPNGQAESPPPLARPAVCPRRGPQIPFVSGFLVGSPGQNITPKYRPCKHRTGP